ncbi:hypothetical protein [Pedobacter frigiditerrae]|uniref:hypothetical protein n=1 Tax=Pedobacter frigiditerrae TaxID=2530452 RepID=UPI00292F4D16|nr:hypothetical protein [Pedobacter frigiditerrae]
MRLKYLFHGVLVPLSILIPIVVFILNYKGHKLAHKFIFYYLVISGLINLTAIILSNYSIPNLPLLHLYTAVEAILLFSYFRSIFKQQTIKKALTFLIVLFPSFCALNFIFLQRHGYNTYTRPLESILITFFCLMYIYKNGFAEKWLQSSINWLNIGILAYFPASLMIFISSNYLIHKGDKTMNNIVWELHAVLVLIMYLVWAKGFKLMGNGR